MKLLRIQRLICHEFNVNEKYLTDREEPIYKDEAALHQTSGDQERVYKKPTEEDLKMIEVFEELMKSNDDEILGHLRRQLPLLKELMDRRKREKAG